MLNFPTRLRFVYWILLACSLPLALTDSSVLGSHSTGAHAAEPLTWKFAPHETFNYRLTQQVKMTMKLSGGGNLQTSIDQTFDLFWQVEKVSDQGEGLLALQIKHIELNVEGPGGQGLHYDSSAEERPAGFAAMLATPLKSLTTETYRMTISPRGEISHVEVPETILEEFKSAPGSEMMGNFATPEALEVMLQSCWLILPENGLLQSDKDWTVTSETTNPVLAGKPRRTNTYHYVGPQNEAEQTLEKFTRLAVTEFDANAGPDGTTIQIVEQQASGEALFHRSAGRLESSTDRQTMTLRFTKDQQTVEQKLEQTVQCQWIPAEPN